MAGKIRKSNLHDDVKTMVTDMISEQALDSADFNSVLSSKTTDDITEGSTNQYYTSTRVNSDFDARLATKDTGDLSEGSNLYYTTSRGDSDTGVYIAGNRTYGNITTTGYIAGPATMTIDPAAVGDNTGTLVVAGNLQVDGTTTTINSTTVEVGDKNIVLGADATANSQNDGAGITVLRPTSSNAILSWDETVGQWEFSHKINVTGTVTADGLTVDASSPTIFFKPSANTETGYITFNNTSGSARGFMKYNYSNDSMSWRTAGISDRMTIDSSGNFFVKTVTEASDDVGHALLADGAAYHTADNRYVGLFNRKTSDGELVQFRKDNVIVGTIGTFSDDLYIHTGDTGLRFNDGNDQIWPVSSGGASRDNAISLGGGTIRFKDLYLSGKITNDGSGGISIDADGKVGIGATDPSSELEVQGTITSRTTNNISNIIMSDDGAGNESTTTNRDAMIVSIPRVPTQKPVSLIHGRFEASANKINIGGMSTHSSGNWDGTGVQGATEINFYTTSAVNTETFSSTSPSMSINNNGNVGIGTTNPSEKLTVNGIIASSSTGYSANVNTANFGLYTSGTNPTTYVQMPASGEFHVWKPSTAAALIVKNNGDVSIGSDHTGFSGWRVLNMRQLSTGALINFEDDDSTRAFTFASQGSGMRYQAHIAGGYHRWETNANPNALYIKDSGNVGINRGINLDSTVTIEQLTDGTDGGIRIYGSNSNSIRGQMYYDGTQSFVIHGTSGPTGEFSTLRFATGAYNNPQIRMSINKDNGNVGIGTTSPGQKLHVDGIVASTNSGQGTGQLQLQGYGNSGYINMSGSNDLIFRLGSGFSEKLRITSAGSVLVKNVATDASQFIFNDGWSAEARNIRVWAEEEVSGGIGRWFSFLGTNVSKDGDGTYTKPSDDASSNWGNIAGMLFTGANTAGQNAIDFVVDLPSAHGGGLNASMSGSDLYNKSAMSITADRKVGIGTRNPQQKLDIVDTNNPNIRIRRNYSLVNGNHIGYQDYYGNSVLYGYHGYWVENASTNASQFRLYTGSGGSVNQRLLITSTGRVNIGDQSTPTEGLEVYGTGGRDNIALKYSGTAGGHQSGYLWKDFRGQQNAGIYNNLQDDGVGTAAANMEFYTSHSGTVTKQMQIDRYGHITMPNQSAFRAYQTTDPTTDGYLTSGNSVSWSEQYDRNNDFSGGTFTAPVNGIYLFTVAWDDNGGNSGIDMWKNASTPVVRWEPDDPTGYAWQSRSWSTHIYLNANEYVQLYGRHSGSSTNPFHMGGGYWGWFSGMLVA